MVGSALRATRFLIRKKSGEVREEKKTLNTPMAEAISGKIPATRTDMETRLLSFLEELKRVGASVSWMAICVMAGIEMDQKNASH